MPLSLSAYLSLGLAIASVPLITQRWVPLTLFALSLVLAVTAGVLNATGLLLVLSWAVVCAVLFQQKHPVWLYYVMVGLLLLAGHLVMTHEAPGFHNLQVLSGAKTSPDAVPYSLYLNFDKAALGFLLFLFAAPRIRTAKDWLRSLLITLLFFFPAAAVLIGATYAAGLVVFDPKLVPFLPIWIFANLLFTCVAEEVFFRQFIMGQLMEKLGRSFWAGTAALVISSLHFAYYHLDGGLPYAAFAFVAGLFYGATFWKSGRVEAAIGVHFLVNLTHILFFTYPMLAK
ncbi:CPBP family intramembrane glutamic endopeptidase [Pseudovibrio sp. Alg231-02]|uniref:CPBP family intramembrane glutamic endopeptidase n=1 Tax=Pseudovibrio sp. Alg231-02 TaxID=1922223 RepID=UPI000D55D6B8|nr:CPBP family intramembrane glutamic endopeptidase [Pseudovibrio sp. Alg231-02]